MPVLSLNLAWAALGIIVGMLALAARLKPAIWGRYGWLWLLLLGLCSALLGGWLGFLLLGRLFSLASALWIAVLATCAPWLSLTLRAYLTAKH